jgi:hypothetical protein
MDNQAILHTDLEIFFLQGSKKIKTLTWLETPTIFCNHPQSSPLPIKLLPKQRALMLLVINSAKMGVPVAVVLENKLGACLGSVTDNPVRLSVSRNPEKKTVRGVP